MVGTRMEEGMYYSKRRSRMTKRKLLREVMEDIEMHPIV
jgi:hypothetical protein